MELRMHSQQGDTGTATLKDGESAEVGQTFCAQRWSADTDSFYLVTAVEGNQVRLRWDRTWNHVEGRAVSFRPPMSGLTVTKVEP
jgi:hypothetical protein